MKGGKILGSVRCLNDKIQVIRLDSRKECMNLVSHLSACKYSHN